MELNKNDLYKEIGVYPGNRYLEFIGYNRDVRKGPGVNESCAHFWVVYHDPGKKVYVTKIAIPLYQIDKRIKKVS